MASAPGIRIGLLYPGDRAARDRADPAASRFGMLFEAFAAAGVAAEPVVWHDDFADAVAMQLRGLQALLVWCNPIEQGRRRDRLDAVLADAARQGVLVSAHPEAVQRLGTKDVLLATRALAFGSDVQRIDSLAALAADLPQRLQAGPRVLKQHRGHSGIGVWRVQASGPGQLLVQHAQRGSAVQTMGWDQLLATLAPYFAPEAGGHMVDQAWQPRLADGMLRAYLVQDRVAGFGHQAVNALHPSQPQPGPRLYHGPDLVAAQVLRQRLESGWVQQLCAAVGLPAAQLPWLWDCDFLHGVPTAADPAPFVLCEINVSSVSPFPPSCVAPLVAAVLRQTSSASSPEGRV